MKTFRLFFVIVFVSGMLGGFTSPASAESPSLRLSCDSEDAVMITNIIAWAGTASMPGWGVASYLGRGIQIIIPTATADVKMLEVGLNFLGEGVTVTRIENVLASFGFGGKIVDGKATSLFIPDKWPCPPPPGLPTLNQEFFSGSAGSPAVSWKQEYTQVVALAFLGFILLGFLRVYVLKPRTA